MRQALEHEFFSSVRDTTMEAECDAPLDFSKLNALGDMDMAQMREFWDYEMEYWTKRRRGQS